MLTAGVNQLTRYAYVVSNDPKQNLNVLELAFSLQKIGDELQRLRETYTLDKDLQNVFEEEVAEPVNLLDIG